MTFSFASNGCADWKISLRLDFFYLLSRISTIISVAYLVTLGLEILHMI